MSFLDPPVPGPLDREVLRQLEQVRLLDLAGGATLPSDAVVDAVTEFNRTDLKQLAGSINASFATSLDLAGPSAFARDDTALLDAAQRLDGPAALQMHRDLFGVVGPLRLSIEPPGHQRWLDAIGSINVSALVQEHRALVTAADLADASGLLDDDLRTRVASYASGFEECVTRLPPSLVGEKFVMPVSPLARKVEQQQELIEVQREFIELQAEENASQAKTIRKKEEVIEALLGRLAELGQEGIGLGQEIHDRIGKVEKLDGLADTDAANDPEPD